MAISKNTIDEMLETYLEDLGLDEKNIKEMTKKVHQGAKVRKKEMDKKERETEKKEREVEKKQRAKEKERSRLSHGTSCPRIMNKYGELVLEM